MKTFRSRSGPFGEQVRYEPEEIESICLDALRAERCLPDNPAPIRIDRFIEKRWGPIRYENLGPNVLGCTEFGSKGVSAVIVATDLDGEQSRPAERRLRSTLAHECGHGLLHAHLFVLGHSTAQGSFGDWSNPQKPRILCRDVGAVSTSQMRRYDGRWWEFQANRAIGALLLPKMLFRKAVAPFAEATGTFGDPILTPSTRMRVVEELASIFDVNPVVVRIRVDEVFPEVSSGQMML